MTRCKNSTFRPGLRASLAVLCLSFIAAFATPPATAQTLTTLHAFTGAMDGSGPQGLVAVDRAANVYGSAPFGARGGCLDGCGAVFRASYKNGAYTFSPLYDFQGGQDGDEPEGGVTLGPDGAIYGTTWFGGGTACGNNSGCGTVFKLTPPPSFCRMVLCPWTETVLYRAAGPSDPSTFIGGVILDNAGNIYGMSFAGGTGNCFGSGCGTVYKLTPSGGSYTPSVLYSFQGGNDGAAPLGNNLAMDAAGNLYGAATYGGQRGFGTVFKLVHSAGGYTFQLLYTFTNGADGAMPQGRVVSEKCVDESWEVVASGGKWRDGPKPAFGQSIRLESPAPSAAQ